MSWPLLEIQEFCRTGSGTTPSRKKPEYYGGDIPWVKSGELRGGIIVDTEEKVTSEALNVAALKMVPCGALLVAMYGATVGRVGLLGIEATTNQAVCHVVADPDRADTRYMFHLLQSKASELVAKGVGGAQPNISQGTIKELKVPLPPLEEQKRIVRILDQADALRRLRQTAITKLNALGQSIFYEMFGDPLSNPKGFQRCKLGEIVKFVGGSQPPKSTFLYEPGPDRVRLVQIRDFRTDEYRTYVPKDLAKRPFGEEDVLIGRYGPPVFQILRGLSGTYNVALVKAQPSQGVTNDFVYYLLQESKLHNYVVANSERTSGQSGVNLKLLNDYPAYLPPHDLLRKFSGCLNAHSQANDIAQKHCEHIASLFTSLQQHAFRGEL